MRSWPETDSATAMISPTVNTVNMVHKLNSLQTVVYTLRSDCQRLALIPLLTPTVDTTYCDVVLIACHETSQFTLCHTGSGDVQKSSIWGLESIGGNVDEVEISTVSTTQCPAHSDIHSSTDIFREVNTGEGGDRVRI